MLVSRKQSVCEYECKCMCCIHLFVFTYTNICYLFSYSHSPAQLYILSFIYLYIYYFVISVLLLFVSVHWKILSLRQFTCVYKHIYMWKSLSDSRRSCFMHASRWEVGHSYSVALSKLRRLENYVIIYSPSCCLKPVCCYFSVKHKRRKLEES